MDLAEYRTLFVLSFTAPAFDPDVAPSFGTLLGTINVALSMLGEVGMRGTTPGWPIWLFSSSFSLRDPVILSSSPVDREEEGAGLPEHRLVGLRRRGPSAKVSPASAPTKP